MTIRVNYGEKTFSRVVFLIAQSCVFLFFEKISQVEYYKTDQLFRLGDSVPCLRCEMLGESFRRESESRHLHLQHPSKPSHRVIRRSAVMVYKHRIISSVTKQCAIQLSDVFRGFDPTGCFKIESAKCL